MNKKLLYFILVLFLSACKSPEKEKSASNESKEVEETKILINKDKNTIKERFSPPKDFEWINEQPETFGYFIENFPLKKYGSQILKYDGSPIATQNLHEAVFDIDTGNLDLQQCADAVIRLHAEYLYKNKRFNEIKYHFTSGDLLSWSDYKNGTRVFVNGNSVSFRKTAPADDSYQNFRSYLDLIYTYAGTISLTNYETKPVTKTENLKTGDILITPGSPGHMVFIAGVAKNKDGKQVFLLGEGFTPAQSIHILSNPFNPNLSPWYELDTTSEETKTARYYFKPTNFRSF
jgi:hypothetical protein